MNPIDHGEFIINKRAVRDYIMKVCEGRYHKFTRVSKAYFEQLDLGVKNIIKNHIATLPSKGKTI